MPRKHEPEETERIHFVLFKDDIEWLQATFDVTTGLWPIGISKAVRTMIRRYRKQIEERAAKGAKHPKAGEIQDVIGEPQA